MNELVELVQQWSANKGLDKADSRGQFLKVVEEVGEVAAALCRSDMDLLKDAIGDVVVTLIIYAQQNDVDVDFLILPTAYTVSSESHESEIISCFLESLPYLLKQTGDCLIDEILACAAYLKIIAIKHNLTLKECLQAAYDVIKLRDGKMVNGIFVKSEDLPKPPYNQSDWDDGDQDRQGDLI
jgi:NTP pyrophosphatase (non-canonical NTP hydrolase)